MMGNRPPAVLIRDVPMAFALLRKLFQRAPAVDIGRLVARLGPHDQDVLAEAVVELYKENRSSTRRETGELVHSIMIEVARSCGPDARRRVAAAFASTPKAPPELIRDFARDEDIGIAIPVLVNSPLLDEEDLLAVARERGMAHLAAIAKRPGISAEITDVLVERGDDEVVLVLASNDAAEISDEALTEIAERARSNYILAGRLIGRQSESGHNVRMLAMLAIEQVNNIRRMIPGAKVVSRFADESLDLVMHLIRGYRSRTYVEIPEQVESELRRQASRRRIDQETFDAAVLARDRQTAMAVLAMLSEVPIRAASQILHAPGHDGIVLMGAAADMPWKSVALFLGVRADGRIDPDELERAYARFDATRRREARQLLSDAVDCEAMMREIEEISLTRRPPEP